MPIMEKIEKYSVYVGQNDYQDFGRSIRLSLASGEQVFFAFPQVRPDPWLSLTAASTTAYLPVSDYEAIYHLLQTEQPVFCTAVDLFGLKVAAVHTELDLAIGEPTGEGFDDRSLEALIVRARNESAP